MSKQKIVLKYPTHVVEEPVIYNLVKDFDLKVNILKADISPRKEGRMVVEIEGDQEKYLKAVDWLKEQGLGIFGLQQQIVWREDLCTECGSCSAFCPTGALEIQRPEMRVNFNESKCVACEHCLMVCPVRAIEAIKEET